MYKKPLFALLTILLCLWGLAPQERPALAGITLTESKLTASDPTLDARFGLAIAIDGDTAIIGAPAANGNASASGAAYIFQYKSGKWTQSAKLISSDGAGGDSFGSSVAIDGDTIAIGAKGQDAAGANAGAVYLFTRMGGTWTEVDKLLPSSAGDTWFGYTIALDGDTLAVGGPYRNSGVTNSGAVYIFRRDASGWGEEKRFATGGGGAVLSDLFGWSVALRGNLLVVGAYLDDVAHVYNRTASGWVKKTTLSGNDTQNADRFGYAVATDGARIIAGATHDDDVGNNAGSAFIFRLNGDTWMQEAKLLPSGSAPLAGSHFGWAVDIDGVTAAAGAANSKGQVDAEESGAVYVYQYGTGWQASALLTATDANAYDHLGTSVVLAANAILAGSPDDDDRASRAGAVYAFMTPDISGEPQTCVSEEKSTEEVIPGMTLTWDSALRCAEAPDEGVYELKVLVEADAGNTAVAVTDAITLTHTTPRPLGQPPEATVEQVTGLPATVSAATAHEFTVTGTYQLVPTGSVKIANLHFCATGYDESTGEPFYLGLNVFLRSPGATEDSGNGPPALPVISHITAKPGPVSATISWQTDLPATSEVMFYPDGLPEMKLKVTRGCLAVQKHQILIKGLLPETAYIFQVQSRNGLDAVATSGDMAFTTTDYVKVFMPFMQH